MLNDSQKIAVQHTSGPMLILAGAGAGKTHTLTERVARMVGEGIPPSKILCVTFTNKAAKEMRERIGKKLGFEKLESVNPYRRSDLPLVGTFHSMGVYFLRLFIDRLGYGKDFVIFDEDDKIRTVKGILEDKKIDDKELPPRQAAYMISAAKNEGIGPEAYRRSADNYAKSLVADIYVEYEKRTKSMNALDFDDILLKLLLILENPEVLEYFHRRFEYFMVDEYQDTNDIQYRIVKLLASKTRNLAVVGDDWQGIYSWRGANIKNILSFERDYPDATVVKLEQNYRSTKKIIEAANAVVKCNKEALEKTLWTDNEDGDMINVIESYDEKEESRGIAEMIAEDKNYADWAILYRTNGQSRLIEEGLIRKNIPYKVFGGVKFYERKEIKDIHSYLRLIFNPQDLVAFTRIINVPSRKLGEKSVEGLRNFMNAQNLSFSEAIERIAEAPEIGPAAKRAFAEFGSMFAGLAEISRTACVKDLMDAVVKRTKYEDYLRNEYSKEEVEGKLENVKEFLNMASRYDGLEPRESLSLFIEDIALITDQDRTDEVGGVSLMTIHLAKGLEFPNVVIAGAEEGLFPHSRSLMEAKAIEEERRLMYVAMTRAKKKLFITRARERYTFGNYAANPASRFLKEIPEHLVVKADPQPKYTFGSFGNSGGFSAGGSGGGGYGAKSAGSSAYSWLNGGSTGESQVEQNPGSAISGTGMSRNGF
ncbi:MAG: UvrD-helicase domain-containing protein [Patescibacteria group bacterium]